MELHISAKHELYKQCLIDIESGREIFCCSSLINRLDEQKLLECTGLTFLYTCNKVFTELYELRVRKTPMSEGPWFDTRKERIEALKKCIEQTK